ncbi:ATPase H(+)-transporting accessory protein 2-like [Macrobrachium nipponense]|uniref:ATPase H(+)-transporting accessory protein 2-like n=1 Tax=Macrobrachium nipponense TaxID=159736 RepID=UPI0030C8B867
MAKLIFLSVFVVCLVSFVHCGEVTVVHAPSTLRFGSASTLRVSNLDDILTSSLGYTPKESSPWNGLTITTPFSLPTAAVVIVVHGGGLTINQEGSTYPLKEDMSMKEAFQSVKSIVGSRAQRETLFKYISVDDDLVEDGPHSFIPTTKVLNMSVEPDATLLRELGTLMKTSMTINEITTTSHGGQDVIFMELNALAPLVKVYGINSAKVKEAIDVVRNQLVRVTDVMRHAYNDQVLVASTVVDQLQELSRPSRSILQSRAAPPMDLNLASEYSSDYPAVFNIVLWISLILIFFIAFTSFAMATMDPGQDSIIYRMTNPRMKKDS